MMQQQQQAPEKPWLPGRKLCAALNDMREARQKQLDVAETLRGGVPRQWWGAQVGSGQHKLGSRLQIIQVLLCPHISVPQGWTLCQQSLQVHRLCDIVQQNSQQSIADTSLATRL